jgi:hypothetical protein
LGDRVSVLHLATAIMRLQSPLLEYFARPFMGWNYEL